MDPALGIPASQRLDSICGRFLGGAAFKEDTFLKRLGAAPGRFQPFAIPSSTDTAHAPDSAANRRKWIWSRHAESGHAKVFFISNQKMLNPGFAIGNAGNAKLN
jgi:hypothetical protein